MKQQKTYRYTGNLFNANGIFIAPEWVKKAYKEGILYYDAHKDLYFDNGHGKVEIKKGDYIGKIETFFAVKVNVNG